MSFSFRLYLAFTAPLTHLNTDHLVHAYISQDRSQHHSMGLLAWRASGSDAWKCLKKVFPHIRQTFLWQDSNSGATLSILDKL